MSMISGLVLYRYLTATSIGATSSSCSIAPGRAALAFHRRNNLQLLDHAGSCSLGIHLLSSAFISMAFTIQFVCEFTHLGLHHFVGSFLTFAHELSPIITAIIAAGHIDSAFVTIKLKHDKS